RRQRSEIIAQRSRALKPVETRIAQTEALIEQNESRTRGLNEAVMQAVESQDGRRIAEISKDIHGCERAIEELFEELEKLSEAHRSQQAEFDFKLSELDTQC
ncbi:MAG: ABC transporter ATP-binding protein, partial [Desulfobacterales bacterium]